MFCLQPAIFQIDLASQNSWRREFWLNKNKNSENAKIKIYEPKFVRKFYFFRNFDPSWLMEKFKIWK